MKIINEAGELDFEFTSALTKMLGVKEEEIADIIEKLSVDELTDLVDASVNGDVQAVKSIIGSETEGEDTGTSSDEPEPDNMFKNMLSSRRSKFSKLKKSTKDRILKKSKEIEIGEDIDPNVTFNIGDTVSVKGEEATIKIPSAPRDTVGVMINGELKMVDKKNVRTLDEAVLGMTAMPGLKPNNDLQRIRELAGMRDDTSDFNAPEPAEFPNQNPMTPPSMSDDMDDVDGTDDMGMDDMGMNAMGMNAMGMDDGDDMGMDHTSSIEMPDMIDHHAEVMPTIVTTMPSMDSGLEDAVALDNAISDIEGLIPNVKISEYKTLVARLKALVSMAENAGKAALTEGRKITINEEDKAKLTYQKMLGSHNVNKNGKFHRSFPTEYDAEKYIKKNQGKSHDELDEAVEESTFVCGDGKRFSNMKDALDHVKRVHEKTGNFISVEEKSDKTRGKTDEDHITPKSSPTSSPKVEQPASMDKRDDVTRVSLMDYVREIKENDEMETIGANRDMALKAFQAKMGPGSTPQKANQAFDAAVAAGTVQNKNGKFQMPPMTDTDFDKSIVKPAIAAAKPTNPATQRSTSSNNQPEQTSNAEPGQSAGRQPIQPRK